jgi:hypothetical protein
MGLMRKSGREQTSRARVLPKAVLYILDLLPRPLITPAFLIVLIAHHNDNRMSVNVNIGILIDGLEVLVPVAKAVPVLGAPVEGALEAVKQILKYAEVSTSDQQAESSMYNWCTASQE